MLPKYLGKNSQYVVGKFTDIFYSVLIKDKFVKINKITNWFQINCKI